MTPSALSLDAERSVLGALLLDPRRALGPVRELLRPADFFAPAHQAVYAAALELEAAGRPVDVITLEEVLAQWVRAYASFMADTAGLITMLAWNACVPALFHLPEVTYWQAFALYLLAHVLLGQVSTKTGKKEE